MSAFTGSLELDSTLGRAPAGRTRQRVEARGHADGSKNGLILDSDADLEESIVDTVAPRLGYQVRVLACSRLSCR